MAAARRLFAAQGYAATGTEEIVQAAEVTRGALYFHFADKGDLFAAILDEVAREVAQAIEAAARNASTPLEALRRGTAAYIDAACDPTRRRIYLTDGPSALGMAAWHAVENRYSLPLLKAGVGAASGNDIDAEALARLLSGAMVEAAGWLSVEPTPPRLRRRLLRSFDTMFEKLFA